MAGITAAQRTALNKVQAKVQEKLSASAAPAEKQKLADMTFKGRPFEAQGPFTISPCGDYISQNGRACFAVLDAQEKGWANVWIKVSDIWENFDPQVDEMSPFEAVSITLAPSAKGDAFFCRAIELA